MDLVDVVSATGPETDVVQPDRALLAQLDALERGAERLVPRGREVLAHVVGPDRQFPVPTVHQDGELDSARAAKVVECVEGSTHGPPRVQHVVDQDDLGAIDG